MSFALVAVGATTAAAAPATPMVDLGAASRYAVLSGASVGNTVNAPTAPHTTVRGDLGVSSGAEPTGFPPGIITGQKLIGAAAVPGYDSLVAAYDEVAARPGGEPMAGDLATKTLTPGLHASVGAISNTGTLTLDGQGDPSATFVVKVDGALAFAAASKVVLINKAQASRVFWQVNGAASVGAQAAFAGTIMAKDAVAMGAGTVVNGRALARTGAISLDSNEFYSQPPLVTINGGPTATTTDTTPAISGTTNVVAPSVVTVTVEGQTLTATPAEDGSWTVTSALLANGTYAVVASATDAAGNQASATQQLTVDTVLPVVTIDGGPSVTTNDSTPTISGTTDVAAGETVSVQVPPQTLSALVQSGGTWNVTPNPPLDDGSRTVTATVTDPAGNQGVDTQTLLIDTVAPAVTITGGALALTNDPTPEITGTAAVPAGRTVTVTVSDQTLTGTVQGDGSWSVTSPKHLTDGAHLVTMSVSDVAGNSASTTQTLTVDTLPPAITIDGGASATTNDLTPTISGTTAASPDTVVTVTIAGQTMSALVQQNGTWNTTPSTVSEGNLTVVASVRDPAGNEGTATQVLTVDTAGPVVTIDGGDARTTSDATPLLSGQSGDVAVGSTVTIKVAGQTLTTTMQAGGTWSATAAVIGNGTHFVFVTVTDQAGNQGSATQALTVAALAPNVTIDGGPSASTYDSTPTITGTADAATGSAVVVTVSGQTLHATIQPGGSWSVTAGQLVDGDHTVTARVTDPEGNVGTAAQALTVNPPVAFDDGSARATNDTTPAISGRSTAADGTPVTVTVAGQTLTTTVEGGAWSVTPTTLADGTYDLDVTVHTDPPQEATQALTVDTVEPEVELDGGSTVETDDQTPSITGSGETPGSTVVVTVDDQTLTTVVGDDGTWSVTPTTLSNGDHAVVVTITDPAGNQGTGNQVITVNAPGTSKVVGYNLVASDGGIFVFGQRQFKGSTGAITLNKPIVGMAMTPTGNGYWLVASDGGIFAFGDAAFFGSTGAIALNRPIVAMASTPTGKGYWLVASDGGIFAFGDAKFFGSTGAIALNKPIVSMGLTKDGGGYWLVASDGGIFAFGNAKFLGSTGAIALNKPIVASGVTPTGNGYWLVASDGGIFAFGDAGFFGSTGAIELNKPIVAFVPTNSGKGYWLVASDGGIFAFGDAGFFGSTGGITLNQPIVGAG